MTTHFLCFAAAVDANEIYYNNMLIILFKPVHPLSAEAGPACTVCTDCIVRAKLKIVRIASAQFIMLYGAAVSAVWHGSGLGLGGCAIVLLTDTPPPMPPHNSLVSQDNRRSGVYVCLCVCAGTFPSLCLSWSASGSNNLKNCSIIYLSICQWNVFIYSQQQ